MKENGKKAYLMEKGKHIFNLLECITKDILIKDMLIQLMAWLYSPKVLIIEEMY